MQTNIGSAQVKLITSSQQWSCRSRCVIHKISDDWDYWAGLLYGSKPLDYVESVRTSQFEALLEDSCEVPGVVWLPEEVSHQFPKATIPNLSLSLTALVVLAVWSWGLAFRKASRLWPSMTPSLTWSTWWENLCILVYSLLREQLTPKSKTHIFPLAFYAIHPYILFWLLSFGFISCWDVCLFLHLMEINCTCLVVLRLLKK